MVSESEFYFPSCVMHSLYSIFIRMFHLSFANQLGFIPHLILHLFSIPVFMFSPGPFYVKHSVHVISLL